MGHSNMDMRIKITKTLTHNAILLLLLAAATLPESSASFGFDSSNSCSPNGKLSRRGRAQMLAAIPCDLGKQAFCHLPGSAYPWHAVRRFVHENQGLMKRMYGDVRHISILRDEILSNEVDVDDMEAAADRYTYNKEGRRAAKYLMHGHGRDRDRDDFGSYKSGNDVHVLMEPHFRPMTTTTSTSTSTTSTTPATSTTTAAPATAAAATSSTVTAAAPAENAVEQLPAAELERPNLDSNSVYEQLPPSSTQAAVEASNNIQIIDSPQLGLRNLSSEAATPPAASTTATITAKVATAAARRNPPLRQWPQKQPLTTSTESVVVTPTTATVAANKGAVHTTVTAANSTASSSAVSSTAATAALPARRNATKAAASTASSAVTTPISFASLFSTTSTALSFDKTRRPAVVAPAVAQASTPASAMGNKAVLRDGQLFQDAMKQEPVAINSNMRGVNACPVKDEVVAPFWANNTRGEVLALLNLYPFEQYVHWEKCTHEFKQMFCRDGCRCEQQYRLHRLLAYDPHNECRGIFSDWFRFPSSCICKCYNIPMEVRATSRSPRSDSSFDAPAPAPAAAHPIEAAEAEVQRAIYEHATDQWYRPRDEFDFFEG